MKANQWMPWSLWAAIHAASLAGMASHGWFLGIAADGALLLCEFDAALCLALCGAWRLAGARQALRGAWAAGSACALLALVYYLAPWTGGSSVGPSRERSAESVSLMQGNTEGKGNPFGWDYDVVALSEIKEGPLSAPPGTRLAIGAKKGEYDSAIYTKLPVLGAGVLAPDKSGWHQGVWARLMTKKGPLLVVSIHTRSPTNRNWVDSRDEFLGQLAAFVQARPQGEPIVISGDWNATPTDKAFRDFLGSGAFAQEPNPWQPTWSSKAASLGLGFRIDRTLGAHGAKISGWRALPRGASDHLFSESVIDILKE